MRDIDKVSDAQLVTSIARYSEVALAEVYRRHGGAVYGLAKRVLNNGAEAEDVTQEVFLRLWNQPDRFDPTRGSLRSFLLAQSHARAVDAVRSSSSRRQREARDAMRTARTRYDIQHEVWDLAVADQVATAMGALPVEERRAIELAYYDGRTYREVARLLGQPEGTVKSRIRNGMRRMRAALADAGVPGGGGVISHEEASELLGAYALHAVDADEVTAVEEHLDTCPRCRAELDGLREVAGALGTSVEEPPDGLWSGIVSRLPERHESTEQVPPMPQLGAPEPSPFRVPATTSRRTRSRATVATIAALAVAAAAVAVVLGIGLV